MGDVLIIGAGGAGRVATHKCVEADDVFDSVCLASIRKQKCDAVAADLDRPIVTRQVDAESRDQLDRLISECKPEAVIHLALPYQNLKIMEACRDAGVHYLDTALYEHPDDPNFLYESQLKYDEDFKKAGITGLLGCGFDPGVTNIFCAYAQEHLFDEIHYVDIVDCNGGDHGLPFATNFNPEINLREVTLPGLYWEDGNWITFPPQSISRTFDLPEVGPRKAYMMAHEEVESLVQHVKGIRRMCFWMTFSDAYIEHLRALENVGLTGIEPVEFDGREIIPIRFLKELLPEPASLAPRYKGKTCIGCLFEGLKDGKLKKAFVYNVCDHKESYREVGSQAISYTTGVPAMIGAMMMLTGKWLEPGVHNVESFDPDPFMEALNTYGLPWQIADDLEAVE